QRNIRQARRSQLRVDAGLTFLKRRPVLEPSVRDLLLDGGCLDDRGCERSGNQYLVVHRTSKSISLTGILASRKPGRHDDATSGAERGTNAAGPRTSGRDAASAAVDLRDGLRAGLLGGCRPRLLDLSHAGEHRLAVGVADGSRV